MRESQFPLTKAWGRAYLGSHQQPAWCQDAAITPQRLIHIATFGQQG